MLCKIPAENIILLRKARDVIHSNKKRCGKETPSTAPLLFTTNSIPTCFGLVKSFFEKSSSRKNYLESQSKINFQLNFLGENPVLRFGKIKIQKNSLLTGWGK